MKQHGRIWVSASALVLLALTGCKAVSPLPDDEPPPQTATTPLVPYAMRWWNVLNAEQRAAALYGDGATAEQATAAGKSYADLDAETRKKVDAAAGEIYQEGFDSVAEWWGSLDCRQKRIAAGDGNTDDPASPYCADYPEEG